MSEVPRALLADADPHSAQVLEPSLQTITELTMVSTAEEALRALGEAAFDIIVIDAALPPAGGVAVLEQAMRLQPSAYRILLSAARPANFQELRRKGLVQDLIRKPALIDDVVALLQSAPLQSQPTFH
ncbi:MAG: response regulator [Myxococcota bacterium]